MRPLVHRASRLWLLVMGGLLSLPATGAGPPCLPCGGVSVEDPMAVAAALEEAPDLEDGARLYVRWRHPVSEPLGDEAETLAAQGATPWLALVFDVPPPLGERPEALDRQLETAASIVAAAPESTHFEVLWESDGAEIDAAEYAFLFKRASTAIAGVDASARVLPRPFTSADELRDFYEHDVAAYLDGVLLDVAAIGEAPGSAVAVVNRLDPGRPIVATGVELPTPSIRALVRAADAAAAGVALTLFEVDDLSAEALAPLVALANEFQGDLSFDEAGSPRLSGPSQAGGSAWAFVRGEDLSLRVVAAPAAPDRAVTLTFPDPHLRQPDRVDPRTGEVRALFDVARGPDGFAVTMETPGPALVLRVDRATAAEIDRGGVEEEMTVATERQMPVEEIVRRLQAFEDRQERRLDHYRARNTTHIRFKGSGETSIEATFTGGFYFRQGEGFDWAWEELYLNGVKWRGERLPEIPLIQPERAAAMPLRIHLSKAYRYTLRGRERIDGREAWVVDFEPTERGRAEDGHLHRGTVWIDTELFARIRTRAQQLGLEGEVVSNRETMHFEPVDASGRPAPWSADSYFLPTRITGQQILTVANATTVVEKETLLTEIEINGDDFAGRRQQTLDSEVTMVRDTEHGLRYLVKDEETGARVVKEGFDPDKLFLLGGVFYDDALDYPLPLAGANYFSFDLAGTGTQANVFFGGVLLQANLSDPEFLGSRFDAGLEGFAIAVPFTDTRYRGEREVPAEEVEVRPASLALELGRPVGAFGRVGLSYDLSHFEFSDTDETGDEFVVPSDHLLQSVELEARFARAGYRLSASGSWNRRSDWQAWGRRLPPGDGSNAESTLFPDFDPEHRDFVRWQLRLAKNWYLAGFRKLGAELVYVDGEDLDRFSSYQFGFFGPTRIHGYQTNRVRADEAWVGHLSYGFEIGQLFRLEGMADAALASSERNALDQETLAGIGVAGTFMGPWQTVVQVDVGVPIAGPDDGFVAYLAFLKLFR